MLRTCDMSSLSELISNPSTSARELSAVCEEARRAIRRATPPESLPPLVCELGALTVRAHVLPPNHSLVLEARDAQPIRFGTIRVQRTFSAFQTMTGLEVEVVFPVIGSPRKRHESLEVTAWIEHNRELVKRSFQKYIRATSPLIEHHWEYNTLLSLLKDIDNLAMIEQQCDSIRRMIAVLEGSTEKRERYRRSAATLQRPPQ
jgi:hypothetical protein